MPSCLLTSQSSSSICIQSLYSHKSLYLLNSIMLSLISSLVISLISSDEKPGVSATKPPDIFKSSVCLVVCLPRPSAFDISFVLILSFLSKLFNSVDFPAPLCPVNTLTLSLNKAFNLSSSVLSNTLYPIFL